MNPKKCPRTNKGIPIFAKAVQTREVIPNFFIERFATKNIVLVFLFNPSQLAFSRTWPVARSELLHIASQTIPYILLSNVFFNVSLVAKLCIVRFFDDDACNLSVLSYCSTGLSPPLAHAKSTLSPSQANAARRLSASRPLILSLSLNFRRNDSSQSENSSFHVLLTSVSCPSVE